MIKTCQKCGGRSWMNGYCLTCESKQANAADRREPTLNDHIEASLDRGFVESGPRLARLLSGSSSPASDLLVAVKAGTTDRAEATRAYNDRLFPRDRVATLEEAARRESDFVQRNDI
jgi:hypothetical protein